MTGTPKHSTIVKTDLISVSPQVMKWIINDSGCETSELAQELDIQENIIEYWKTKGGEIKITNLNKLSKYLKRPLAIFLLEKPPEQPYIPDYREGKNNRVSKLTRDTLASIRNVRYLQSIAKELMDLHGTNQYPNIRQKISIHVSPEKTAEIECKKLGLESNNARSTGQYDRHSRTFYNILRECIESFNIFVFQADMSVMQVQGLTLSEHRPNVILVNSKDSNKGRIFSLLHGYGHILLKKNGLCTPEASFRFNQPTQNIESWCNTFAASVLMPKTKFLSEYFEIRKDMDPKQTVDHLSHIFNANIITTAVRIKNLVPNDDGVLQYLNLLDSDVFTADRKNNRGETFAITRCIGEKGKKFISLVLESKNRGHITTYDVTDYLDIDVTHMNTVEEEIS